VLRLLVWAVVLQPPLQLFLQQLRTGPQYPSSFDARRLLPEVL